MVDVRRSLTFNEFDIILNMLLGRGVITGSVYKNNKSPVSAFKTIVEQQKNVFNNMNNPVMTPIYKAINVAFNTYKNQENINIDYAKKLINNLVRPLSCDKRSGQNTVEGEEYFVRSVLFLICLLVMKHNNIPEQEYFSKKTGLFGSTVSLLEHLIKKKDEQGEPCSSLYNELLNVYNFSNTIVEMTQHGGSWKSMFGYQNTSDKLNDLLWSFFVKPIVNTFESAKDNFTVEYNTLLEKSSSLPNRYTETIKQYLTSKTKIPEYLTELLNKHKLINSCDHLFVEKLKFISNIPELKMILTEELAKLSPEENTFFNRCLQNGGKRKFRQTRLRKRNRNRKTRRS